MVARLADLADQGVPIVGAEPSCLLTLRDEYPALLPGDPRAEAVAAATRLPEELLAAAVADGRLVLAGAGKRILFHGHCHQKAITGTAATVALLRAIAGAEVTEVDAGAVAWPARSASRRSTTTCPCGSANSASSRRSAPSPGKRSSPQPGCPAASRSLTGPAGRPATRWR